LEQKPNRFAGYAGPVAGSASPFRPAAYDTEAQEQWFALYVRSHFEKVAERCLRGKGYQAFSPVYQILRKRAGRSKKVDLPLFPGYVFCHFDANERLPILTTPGVVTVVGGGNIPEPIEVAEIRSLQMLRELGHPLQPWPFLREGQRVRIDAGPLAGTEGTLLKMRDELRLVVSITLLQRSLAVVIDRDSVRPMFGARRSFDA
jgi:transcription antitermination factor NusG